MGDMVAGWIVSISLFVVCGCVALLVVKIVNYLDRATSMGEDVEVENSPHDDHARLALSGDVAIGAAVADAAESNELNQPQGSLGATDHIESPLDARSSAVNECETSPDRGAGPDIPNAPGRDGSPARGG